MCDGSSLVWCPIHVPGKDWLSEGLHEESVLLGEVLIYKHPSCSRVEEHL